MRNLIVYCRWLTCGRQPIRWNWCLRQWSISQLGNCSWQWAAANHSKRARKRERERERWGLAGKFKVQRARTGSVIYVMNPLANLLLALIRCWFVWLMAQSNLRFLPSTNLSLPPLPPLPPLVHLLCLCSQFKRQFQFHGRLPALAQVWAWVRVWVWQSSKKP